jgi:hypothetical protein
MSEQLDQLQDALHRGLRAGYLCAKRRLLLLNLAPPEPHFYPIEGDRHLGDPQQLIDALVLDAVENELRKVIPLIRVVGEESLRSIIASDYPIAILDPVDGTKPATHLGHGWAVVLIILYLPPESEELRVAAAGILSSNGILVSVIDEKDGVFVELVETDDEPVIVAATAPSNGAHLSVACVGAKPSDAVAVARLRVRCPEATVFNLGGNPMVWGVLLGDLDAIVSFKSQSSWDASYALMVALADGVVGSSESHRVFQRAEVLDWFRTPPHGDERDTKVVPPIIVAKDYDTYRALTKALDSGVSSAT